MWGRGSVHVCKRRVGRGPSHAISCSTPAPAVRMNTAAKLVRVVKACAGFQSLGRARSAKGASCHSRARGLGRRAVGFMASAPSGHCERLIIKTRKSTTWYPLSLVCARACVYVCRGRWCLFFGARKMKDRDGGWVGSGYGYGYGYWCGGASGAGAACSRCKYQPPAAARVARGRERTSIHGGRRWRPVLLGVLKTPSRCRAGCISAAQPQVHACGLCFFHHRSAFSSKLRRPKALFECPIVGTPRVTPTPSHPTLATENKQGGEEKGG